MRWCAGVGALVCMAVVGCSARKVRSHEVYADRDSLMQLSVERAFVEQRSSSIELEWWGDVVDHLSMVLRDSVVSDSTSSGRSGIRVRIDDRMWTRTDEVTANSVRMKQTRFEDDYAFPNTTRWRWMGWMAPAAIVIMIVWYGLRSIK